MDSPASHLPDPLDRVSWPVRTARLAIRPAVAADAAATFAFRRLPEVHRWLTTGETDAGAYAERFARPERLASTLVVERDGVVVGDLMLKVQDGWAQAEVVDGARRAEAELGWVLDPAHHGQGLGREMVSALVALAFDQVGLRRVTAGCFVDNEPSWRLMEAVGLRREAHTIADALHRDLGWVDGYLYALLADEWRARPDVTGR